MLFGECLYGELPPKSTTFSFGMKRMMWPQLDDYKFQTCKGVCVLYGEVSTESTQPNHRGTTLLTVADFKESAHKR